MFIHTSNLPHHGIVIFLCHNSSVLGIAFAFGMALMVTAWAFGRISGALFNPAITLSCLITGNLCIAKAIMYFICQLLGACLGVAMARGNTPDNAKLGVINYLVSVGEGGGEGKNIFTFGSYRLFCDSV